MKKIYFILFFAIAATLFNSKAIGQVSFRSASTATVSSSTTTITVNAPAGIAANDVLIAVIAKQGNVADPTGPSGWTKIAGTDLDGSTARNGSVWYKVATGSEPGSYQWTALGAGTNHVTGSIAAYYNVDVTGTPFSVAPASELSLSGSGSNTATASPTIPAIANAGIVMCVAVAGSTTNFNSNWACASGPASLAEVVDIGEGSTSDGTAVGIAWSTKSSSGTTGNGTVTLSSEEGERNGALLIALKPFSFTVNAGHDQLVSGTSVTLSGSTTAGGSPTYAWTKTSGGAATVASPSASATTVTGLVAGTYVFRLTVNGSVFDEVTVVVVSGVNLWASSGNGTQISNFAVNSGSLTSSGNHFVPTFPGTTTGGTTTAAIGRNASPTLSAGYFYWLPNTSGNSGVVEVFAASAAGGTPTRIGAFDVNGGNTNSLGFVRLGMGPDGTGWILAGDGTTLYIAYFMSNGINAVTFSTKTVTLVGGSVATFQNGDVCVSGNNTMYALANDGAGLTQIFIGTLSNPTVTLTQKWNLVDPLNVAFAGSVNGVAFDALGSLYITTAVGLYYINQATVNGPAGTVQCALVQLQTGLQDLASNVFPAQTTLPVKLDNFTVNRQGSNAILNWTTATEINTDRFEIERSYDGVNFSAVGSKPAAGNSTSARSYQYADPITVSSGNIYYRLNSFDIDGKSSYSKIVVLRLNGGLVKNFSVFPNPFTSDLKIQINSEKEMEVIMHISNAAGQLVVNRSITLQKGENIVVLTSEIQNLPSGMHLMEIITEDGKLTQKIIKR